MPAKVHSSRAPLGVLRAPTRTLWVQTKRVTEVTDLGEALKTLIREAPIGAGAISLLLQESGCSLYAGDFPKVSAAESERPVAAVRPGTTSHFDTALGPSVSAIARALIVQVSKGELVLGPTQRVLMIERSGPRTRELSAQIWRIA